MLTQDLLWELFEYNPETGILTNKVSRGRSKAGTEVGTLHRDGSNTYRRVKINGKSYMIHRLIWVMQVGTEPDIIDHKDGNGLNNKWDNLRSVNKQENNRNQRKRKDNVSGVCGVCWATQSNKWVVIINFDGKQHKLGYFKNFDDAVAARLRAEIGHGYHPNHGQDRPL